jgi:hypothetical protein
MTDEDRDSLVQRVAALGEAAGTVVGLMIRDGTFTEAEGRDLLLDAIILASTGIRFCPAEASE